MGAEQEALTPEERRIIRQAAQRYDELKAQAQGVAHIVFGIANELPNALERKHYLQEVVRELDRQLSVTEAAEHVARHRRRTFVIPDAEARGEEARR